MNGNVTFCTGNGRIFGSGGRGGGEKEEEAAETEFQEKWGYSK